VASDGATLVSQDAVNTLAVGMSLSAGVMDGAVDL
jgi:hypothetical protein